MKYAVILGDGMADLPEACPGGRTPLELARTTVLDQLCGGGETGLVRTVPEGMAPGSDTANLSILGYGGKQYYRGRRPWRPWPWGSAWEFMTWHSAAI